MIQGLLYEAGKEDETVGPFRLFQPGYVGLPLAVAGVGYLLAAAPRLLAAPVVVVAGGGAGFKDRSEELLTEVRMCVCVCVMFCMYVLLYGVCQVSGLHFVGALARLDASFSRFPVLWPKEQASLFIRDKRAKRSHAVLQEDVASEHLQTHRQNHPAL